MSVINAGEVWYIIARRTNAAEADRAIRTLQNIEIKFINADWPLTKIAAAFIVRTASGSDRVAALV